MILIGLANVEIQSSKNAYKFDTKIEFFAFLGIDNFFKLFYISWFKIAALRVTRGVLGAYSWVCTIFSLRDMK